MLNPRAYYNSRPDGAGVLELPADVGPRQFAPRKRTDLTGEVAGPLAALRLTQTFALAGPPDADPVEALYRFPLPGDAAVTGVVVHFGDVEIRAAVKERAAAEAEYADARRTGRPAALVTRESPDVFTLAVAGVRPGQDVVVETAFVLLARPDGAGWSLRLPLTTAPRYVRDDEAGGRHAHGQPLAVLRDPGHRFALDLAVPAATAVRSPTHELSVSGDRVRLAAGEVVPDRDCVVAWTPAGEDAGRPAVRAWVHPDPAAGRAYFLALVTPPASAPPAPTAREVVLLVDRSGSMRGPKWEAAEWAAERFLAGLTDRDSFALGLFHSTTRWFADRPRPATPDAVREAVEFLRRHRDDGGTELGVALEQALALPRTPGSPARHVLVVTDAEVTDGGRLLRLVDADARRADRRRVSVLCVDAAPNATLATELAERGGGLARFLTSDPNEGDVTTALDEVLVDWAAPVLADAKLVIDRPGAEAAGRATLPVGRTATEIDLGDVPAGRPVWVVGRAPLGDGRVAFRLAAADGSAVADGEATDTGPGPKVLFGAGRVRRLEYLLHAGLSAGELRAECDRLGYAGEPGAAVYAENDRTGATAAVRRRLVAEALDFGLPSSETAFVAVRSEAGQRVGETVVVANALPAGWSSRFAGGGQLFLGGAACAVLAAPGAPSHPGGPKFRSTAPKSVSLTAEQIARLRGLERQRGGQKSSPDAAAARPSPPLAQEDVIEQSFGSRVRSRRGGNARPAASFTETRIPVPARTTPAGVPDTLFDSARDAAPALPDGGRLASLAVAGIAADGIDPGLILLVFVGDGDEPRAKVRLTDVVRHGRRPLNLRRGPGEVVRVALADPAGAWAGGRPALDLVLGWA